MILKLYNYEEAARTKASHNEYLFIVRLEISEEQKRESSDRKCIQKAEIDSPVKLKIIKFIRCQTHTVMKPLATLVTLHHFHPTAKFKKNYSANRKPVLTIFTLTLM